MGVVSPCFHPARMRLSTCASTPFMPSRHRFRRQPLQIGIERSVDAQAVMVEIGIAQPLHQPVAHQVDEVRRLTRVDIHRAQVERLPPWLASPVLW